MKYILKNGLSIVTNYNSHNELIYASIFIKVGSKNEIDDEIGYSHLIEHIIFSQISRECRNLVCECNAITTREYTCYYIVCLKKDIKKAMHVFLNIWDVNKLFNSEIDKDIAIIKQEILSQYAETDYLLDDTLMKIVYGNKGLGNSIVGSFESLDSMKKDGLLKYYLKYYSINCAVLSIQGDVNTFELEWFEEIFGEVKKFEDRKQQESLNQNMIRGNKLQYIVGDGIAKCVMALKGCSCQNSLEPVYELCSRVIGMGNKSILYEYLRNELGLVYNIYSEKISFFDSGIIYIFFDTSIDNFFYTINKIAYLFDRGILRKIDTVLISKMKEQLQFDLQRQYSDDSAIMTEEALSILFDRKSKCSRQYINTITDIKEDVVLEVMTRILNAEKKVVYSMPISQNTKMKSILFF